MGALVPAFVVRHPMYAAYVVWLLATPLALGSLPALLPSREPYFLALRW